MSGPSLARLLGMPREELAWRLSTRARIERQRLAFAVRRPRWRRGDIRGALAPDLLDAPMRAAITARDWPLVHTALRERMLARPSRYVLDHGSAAPLRREITARWPEAPGDSSRRGDRLLSGTYDLLGYQGVACTDCHSDPVNG